MLEFTFSLPGNVVDVTWVLLAGCCYSHIASFCMPGEYAVAVILETEVRISNPSHAYTNHNEIQHWRLNPGFVLDRLADS